LAEFPEIAFEMMNWDQELLRAKEKSPLSPGKASVVKGEDKEGKYKEHIIRRRLPAARRELKVKRFPRDLNKTTLHKTPIIRISV
jgi:hypothetical protein